MAFGIKYVKKEKNSIFNKSERKLKQYKFFFNNQDLELVTEYRYMGTVIKASEIIDIKPYHIKV